MDKIRAYVSNLTVLCFFLLQVDACAENIDPHNLGNQYAYCENTGWVNFEPEYGDGVQVSMHKLVGWCWCENIGWLSLSCENTDSCDNINYGVINDGTGVLSGFVWGENVGWINFKPIVSSDKEDYGVEIDEQGRFSGWAWGQNIGWINFNPGKHYVVACKVTLEDLVEFCDEWLEYGNIAANLNNEGRVDSVDYAILSNLFLDFCPDGWELKR